MWELYSYWDYEPKFKSTAFNLPVMVKDPDLTTEQFEYWKKDVYKRQLHEWPEEAVDESGLLIAPGKPMNESHRHFSHLLSFHPFGLIDVRSEEHTSELQSLSRISYAVFCLKNKPPFYHHPEY